MQATSFVFLALSAFTWVMPDLCEYNGIITDRNDGQKSENEIQVVIN